MKPIKSDVIGVSVTFKNPLVFWTKRYYGTWWLTSNREVHLYVGCVIDFLRQFWLFRFIDLDSAKLKGLPRSGYDLTKN